MQEYFFMWIYTRDSLGSKVAHLSPIGLVIQPSITILIVLVKGHTRTIYVQFYKIEQSSLEDIVFSL